LPDLNKAIEYNGLYWHSLPKAKLNGKIKKQECNKLGIDLFVIKEEDYLKDKQKVLKNIYNFIKK